MEKQLCSYCQREYGTLSIKNRPIYRTFDHLEPRSGNSRRCIDRTAIGSKVINNLDEVNNLLQCCNECNYLKGRLSLRKFKRSLRNFLDYKYMNNTRKYLTKELIVIIRKSIDVIIKNKCEPISINYENRILY